MAVDAVHPAYSKFMAIWDQMTHTYEGEHTVKEEGAIYLPPLASHVLAGMGVDGKGLSRYLAYKQRAVFPSYVNDAVRAMVGAMHEIPAVIDLPPQLEPLRKAATPQKESLLLLLRRINEAQLVTGRLGLLADLTDVVTQGQVLPYIATYPAKAIINWDNGQRDIPKIHALNLVVLDESEMVRQDDFTWRKVVKHRILVLGDIQANEAVASYRQAVIVERASFDPTALKAPVYRGQELEQIPFVFVNAGDLVPMPSVPPLLQLSDACLTIYRGEADYRQALHLACQDTFVVIGGNPDDEYILGPGAGINLPQGADAKYVGPNSQGIPEQRSALENDHRRASEIGGALLNTRPGTAESGDALRIRVAAQTTTLRQIALAGAEALQSILRIIATWVGADPAAVTVTPNTEFSGAKMTPLELASLMAAKQAGLPLSDESIHELLRENDYTEEEFAKEMARIKAEQAAKAPPPAVPPVPPQPPPPTQ